MAKETVTWHVAYILQNKRKKNERTLLVIYIYTLLNNWLFEGLRVTLKWSRVFFPMWISALANEEEMIIQYGFSGYTFLKRLNYSDHIVDGTTRKYTSGSCENC